MVDSGMLTEQAPVFAFFHRGIFSWKQIQVLGHWDCVKEDLKRFIRFFRKC